MNKKEFIEELSKRLNLEESKVILINDILEDHMLVGRKNKEKIVSEIVDKLYISNEEAENIYKEFMNIFTSEIKDKLKHPFRSKD